MSLLNSVFLWIGAALSSSDYPVKEWLAPVDHAALEVAESGWSGAIFRNLYIGRGETPANWSRRIITWSAPSDMWGAGSVATQATTAREAVMADCPGSRSGRLRLFNWSGKPAAEFWIACDRLPQTGRPDHYLVRMIAGEEQLLSAAITFRARPTTAQIAAAGSYLDTLIICTEATAGPACRSVPAPPRSVASEPR